MKLVKRISDILAWGVYIIIIAVLFVAAPMVAGYRPMVVLSGSMEPTYPVGCVMYYKHQPFGNIQTGDAITIQIDDNGSYVTHRVTQKNELSQTFVTKGDANPTEDPEPVSYDRVAGVALKYKVPYAGYAVSYIKDFRVIGTLVALLLINIVLDIATGKKKSDKKVVPDKSGKVEESEEHENV